MKLCLPAILACALSLHAQDTPAPAPAPAPSPSPAAGITPLLQGKIELEIDGKKETLDLSDPATALRLKEKVIVVTEINGHRATRVVDAKDAEKLPAPFLFSEKPPMRTGPVTFLGIGAIEVPADVAAQLTLPQDTGLQIAVLLPESPAAKAGLQESDILQKFEDQILVTPRQLAVLIANHKEGDAVKLSILRKGAPLEIPVTLGKRDVPHLAESADKVAKVTREMMKLDDSDSELARKLTEALHGQVKMKFQMLPAPGEKSRVGTLLEEGDEPLSDRTISGVPAAPTPKSPSPASEDTGKALRKALDKLPPEERPSVEKFLKENDMLSKEALPPQK